MANHASNWSSFTTCLAHRRKCSSKSTPQCGHSHGNVFRLAHAAQRHVGNPFLGDVGVVMVGAGHGGIYEPGMDRVSPDVLGGVLDGSGLVED